MTAIISLPRATDAARLAEIALTVARNGTTTVARRSPALVRRPRRNAPRSVAVTLRRSFVDLGPTLVKLGQLIASSPGLFPDVLSDEMRRLLDNVPPEPASKVRRVVERELGAPIAERVPRLRRRAGRLGVDRAGSPGRAARRHRGRGQGQAPSSAGPDRTGPAALAGACRRPIEGGIVGETVNPVALIEDLASTLRAELDFRLEAEAMAGFAANLESSGRHGQVVVPRAIDGMVTERVLVMTFIAGTPVDDGDALAGRRSRPRRRSCDPRCGRGSKARSYMASFTAMSTPATSPSPRTGKLPSSTSASPDGSTSARGRVLRRTLPAVLIDGDFGAVVRGVFDLGAAPQSVDIAQATADTAIFSRPSPSCPWGRSATAR